MMSEMEVGTASRVWSVSAPLERMASIMEMATMAKALSWLSQATVMDVKPTPPAFRTDTTENEENLVKILNAVKEGDPNDAD